MGWKGGASLVDLAVALSILAGGLVATVGALLQAQNLDRLSREEALAVNAARERIERMGDEPVFSWTFAIFNSDLSDDPTGDAPGADFAVPGLEAQDGDADGMAGRIEFPTAAGAPRVLREDLTIPEMGMPKDLNGDGVVDGADHSSDYTILPFLIRIEWKSGRRARERVFWSALAEEG